MSEIEKMYENANVKQDRMCEWTCKGSEHCSTNCEHYESTQLYYPPFTAEKQIELIKWLSKSKNGFGFLSDGYTSSCHCDFDCEWFEENFYAEDFDNALSGLINNLWQSLTSEEKQQIKEILE